MLRRNRHRLAFAKISKASSPPTTMRPLWTLSSPTRSPPCPLPYLHSARRRSNLPRTSKSTKDFHLHLLMASFKTFSFGAKSRGSAYLVMMIHDKEQVLTSCGSFPMIELCEGYDTQNINNDLQFLIKVRGEIFLKQNGRSVDQPLSLSNLFISS